MAAYRVATRLRFATAHSELQHVRHGASFGSLCAKTLYAIIPKNVMLPARNESIDRPFCDLSACHKLVRSEEHTSELQSLMRISYAVFGLTKKSNEKPHK